MEVQNISGPDIVQNRPNSTPETTQSTEVQPQQTEVVQNEDKGNSFDSYA